MSNITAPTFDVAIIGAGFSGILTLAQLIKQAKEPLKIAIFSRSNTARGVAYSTLDYKHLLNVPAHNMSAFPDEPDHFLNWLGSREDTKKYTRGDFVPRRIYGEYLGDIFAAAKTQQKHTVQTFEDEVISIDGEHVITTAKGAFPARHIILATGNEAAQTKSTGSTITPWELLEHPLPKDNESVVILGAGLTGVDAFLTLRARGFKGKIYLVSRSGRIPQSHLKDPQKYIWDGEIPHKLSSLLHQLIARARSARWQEVVDSLRPHLQNIWKQQTINARRSFLTKYFGLWNIHRHRMAPQIWEKLQSDTNLEILATRKKPLPTAALTIHCIGQEYRTKTLRNPLIQQMLRDGLMVEHESGFGVKAAGFSVGVGIFAIGPLLIGELLETTAVPELRGQAQAIVQQLL